MIYLITFMIVYSILTSFNHKAMIKNNSGLWHSLSAVIDGFVVILFVLFLRYNWFHIYVWTDFIAIACMYMLIRDVTRTIILGIGTTSWIDRKIKGFGRMTIWLFLSFITAIYLIEYWMYAGTNKSLDSLDSFLNLFR